MGSRTHSALEQLIILPFFFLFNFLILMAR